MLVLCLYLCRRFYRGFVVHLVAFSLIWAPVMQARAIPPVAVALVPAAVMLARVFATAAARVGPQLTYTNAAAGTGLALVALAGENWTSVQEYAVSAAAAFHTTISNGATSVASLASSLAVNSLVTDFATYSLNAAGGSVFSSYGRTPTRDPLPAEPGDPAFPSSPRWDGNPGFQPIPGASFSTVWNASGFKTYLCPVMNTGPTSDVMAQFCSGLPEMPFSTFNYGTQFSQIGIGCNYPTECAQAYVAARLVQLSHAPSNTTDNQGHRVYLNIISNVTVQNASCYDSRFAGNPTFNSWRCPVTLGYEIQQWSGLQYSAPSPVSEQYNVDVIMNAPPISQAGSLNDYIDRYPLAGNHPVTPATLAQIANAMFSAAAAKPGYVGINYFPITAADAVSAAQPGEVVPLSSMVAPIAGAPTTPGTGTGTGNPPATGGTIDLGPNPGVGAPTLEGIPTAAQILAPVFDLFPSLRNFSVPGHTSTCPPLQLTLFNQDISSSKHCEVIEGQRSAFGAAALAMWTILTVVIVLGA